MPGDRPCEEALNRHVARLTAVFSTSALTAEDLLTHMLEVPFGAMINHIV